jgi:hypothetical protein
MKLYCENLEKFEVVFLYQNRYADIYIIPFLSVQEIKSAQ